MKRLLILLMLVAGLTLFLAACGSGGSSSTGSSDWDTMQWDNDNWA